MSEADKISLYRFEEGYSPITLEKKIPSYQVSCELFEDALDDPLDPTIDFPVEYPQPEDALLLHCRFPKPSKTLLQEMNTTANNSDANDDTTPIASITGLPEEFGERKPILNVSVYQGYIDSSSSPSSSAPTDNKCCEAPHNSWTRQPLEKIANRRKKSLPEDPVDLMWVDLRTCNSRETILFPSLTSVAHFFRSLMGTSHSSSPWCPHDEKQPTNNNKQQHRKPHRIAVLFSGTPPDVIYDVRVGDICPSWSLYSIARVKIPQSWSPWASTRTEIAVLEPATLLIFKPLPPRPCFGLKPTPKVIQDETPLKSLPKGCLWELYFEYREDEEGEEENGHDDEKKQSVVEKKARKIPHVRMTSPPYISAQEDYDYKNMLQPLIENWQVIREEALQIPQWTAWPETQHYSKARSRRGMEQDDEDDDGDDDDDEPFHPSWNVFPLCHCFPANQVENKKWIEQTCAFVPQTIHLLKQHLGSTLRTALFSRLDPETTLEAHTGWSDLANHVFRCHLPLVVPPGGVCGTWVDGCVETHEEGRFLCFDDSKTHRAFNYSNGDRIVLILDLARPDHLPIGTATGGHSDELDQFIASMNM